VSDAIQQLRETHALQLAAISTASVQNTETTVKDRIDRDNPYWTQAYGDVCAAVDREMKHRIDHYEACDLAAKMHAAAVGSVRGPTVGVVEDVEDLRASHERMRTALQKLVGVVTTQELKALKEMIAAMPAPPEDAQSALVAINALLEAVD
jgi:hypothetical protein